MNPSDRKRAVGQYFTSGNPFNNVPFVNWTTQAGLPENSILEPFADCQYDNLYKCALEKCLDNGGYIAVLIPEFLIIVNFFQNRLQTYLS